MTGAEDFGKKEGGRRLSEIFTGVNEHLPFIHQDYKTNGLADCIHSSSAPLDGDGRRSRKERRKGYDGILDNLRGDAHSHIPDRAVINSGMFHQVLGLIIE
jgi:hypothetical protein